MKKMKLPNGKNAYVSKEKLVDYILSETHPVGSTKAKFFRGLGFKERNMGQLAKSLIQIARANEIKSSRESIYGINYLIEGKVKTPSGKTVVIITVWFIEKGGNRPSFVTAYPV